MTTTMKTATTMALATTSARQGDVIMNRTGDAPAGGDPTPEGGIVLVRGSHASHIIMATKCRAEVGPDSGVVEIPEGGVLHHDGAPGRAHAPIRLAPGRWAYHIQRELGLDNCVKKVVD